MYPRSWMHSSNIPTQSCLYILKFDDGDFVLVGQFRDDDSSINSEPTCRSGDHHIYRTTTQNSSKRSLPADANPIVLIADYIDGYRNLVQIKTLYDIPNPDLFIDMFSHFIYISPQFNQVDIPEASRRKIPNSGVWEDHVRTYKFTFGV